jgi:hypothetical protein
MCDTLELYSSGRLDRLARLLHRILADRLLGLGRHLLRLALDRPVPERLEPSGRILWRPRVRSIRSIDVNDTESGRVTFLPFKVVQKGPGHVSVASHSPGYGLHELFEVASVVVDSFSVLDKLGKRFKVFVLDAEALEVWDIDIRIY